MTTLTTILAAVDQLRQQLQDVRLDHPWDSNVRRNSIARLDALRSDLSVAEKRQGEDGDCLIPAGESVIPFDGTSDAVLIGGDAATGTKPQWMVSGVPHRVNPRSGSKAPVRGFTYDPATDQAVPVDNDESLRAPVVIRTTTEDATVIDREDGTRTTIGLDGSVAIEQRPVTESLMRAVQVGWVVRTVGGDSGVIDYANGWVIEAKIRDSRTQWSRAYGAWHPIRELQLVSLAPPDVVAELDEVVL